MVSEKGMGVPAIVDDATGGRVRIDTETVRETVIVLVLHELQRHPLYALLGCAYTSGLMRDECQLHISC